MSASSGKSRWIICPECEGEGKSSRHLGVINTEDWDEDDMEAYMEGQYYRRCDCCGGSGKVREANLSNFYQDEADRKEAYRYACKEDGRVFDW
jgi:hypothetical protein